MVKKELSYKDKMLGALWLQKSKKGREYYSGKIMIGGNQTYIILLKNTYYEKDGDKPFYNILLSDKKEE